MMGKYAELPEDVVVEIMSRIPPESLLKFKQIGKSWYSLINHLIRDPKFVHKNLQNNNNNEVLCLAFEGIKYYPQTYEFSIKIFNGEDIETDIINGELKSFLSIMARPRPLDLNLAGYHCNGVLCIVNHELGEILLCNPTTKQAKFLPGTAAPSCPFSKTSTLRVGFGHDHIDNVYKVVKICNDMVVPYKAQVYTLGDDDSNARPLWREIDLQIDARFHRVVANTEMYCGGVYYWMDKKAEAIHSFDMHDEVFRTIALPDEFTSLPSYDTRTNLCPWNESVALLHHSYWIREIKMWVMNENVPHHWTKHQSIRYWENIGFTFFPVAFLKSNQLLLRKHSAMPEYLSFDLLTKERRTIFKHAYKNCSAFVYVKSLVSLIRPNSIKGLSRDRIQS